MSNQHYDYICPKTVYGRALTESPPHRGRVGRGLRDLRAAPIGRDVSAPAASPEWIVQVIGMPSDSGERPPVVAPAAHALLLFYLTGPFRIETPAGENVTPRSRRAQALLAMLCLAPRGQRSRIWLRDKLWSDRDEHQGAASLRQELLVIRKSLGAAAGHVLTIDRMTVALSLSRIKIIAGKGRRSEEGAACEELLEGIEINDEEFEDWLRKERQNWPAEVEQAEAETAPVPPPGVESLSVAMPVLQVEVAKARTGAALTAEALQRDRWRVLLMGPAGVGQSGGPALAAAMVMGLLRTSLLETGDLEVVEPVGGLSLLQEIRGDPALVAGLVLQPHLAWDERRVAVRLALKVSETGALVWSGQSVLAADDIINGQGADLFQLISQALDETTGYFLRISEERALAQNRLAAAVSLMFQLDLRHLDRAEEALRARLGTEFGNAETHAWLAFLMTFRVGQRFNAHDRPVVEEAQMFARRALEGGRGSAIVNALVGHVHSYLLGEYDLAAELFSESLRIQPENLVALDLAATLNVYTGRVGEALSLARRALAIGRFSPNHFYFETTLGLASTFAGDYRTAIATARSALAARPAFNSLLRIMVASFGNLGDLDQARSYHAKLLESEPQFSISYLRDIGYPGLATEAGKVFLEGLRRAGVR
jgi:tetratricopeptide (TPR) repeat protein